VIVPGQHKGKKNRVGWFNNIKKTPTLLQMEAVECGAAALGIVMRHYGLYLPLEALRQECGVNRDGSKASNIVKAARRFGLVAKGYRYSTDQLSKVRLPAILHWEFNHFVVLEGFKGDNAYINDPAVGHRVVPLASFLTSYTGIVLDIRPTAEFRKGGEKFRVTHAVAKKLADDKLALVFVMLVGLMMVVPSLANPVFNQIYIDDILSGRHTDWLFNLMLAMGVAALLDGVLTALRVRCLGNWRRKLSLKGSSSFFWHVLRLPVSFFQQRYAGEIATRVGFNAGIAEVLTGEAATVLLDFLVALFFLVLLLHYSWQLTIIGVLFSVINVLLFSLVRKRLLELTLRVQQDQGKVMGTAINGLTAIETLKANGNESDFFSKWAGSYAKYIKGEQEIQLASQFLSVAPMVASAINTALIMIIGGFQIMDGLMTAGVFMAFRSLMGNFQEPLGKILGLAQSLQGTEMHMQRLGDVMNYSIDEGIVHDPAPEAAGITKLSGAVRLENVSFGYNPLDPPLIENLDLAIKPGRWVALVGGSGSGKSTIAKLVNGLYKEWSGDLSFDGFARRELTREAVVNSIATVSQEICIFKGTVRENISLFDSSVPEADIVRAARDAAIHDDITRLEGGYDGELAENGTNLSGGQRQRIEICRALSVNPSLLILDEATSALDPVTEETILTNIRRRGCSCLVVAHRLSAFRDCDEILVLENGKVAQRGTHAEMIGADGLYRDLVSDAGGREKGDA
jgi:NHLM bacteriocin system ABC transporter, peptidase/ATP-binding protein